MGLPTGVHARGEALDGAAQAGDFGREFAFPPEAPMGWFAILAIFVFVVAIVVINRIEFGRFD
jgi:hypothetical protein